MKFIVDAQRPRRFARDLAAAGHDIQILMAVGKLTPLGVPAPNAPKWFAAVELIRLAADQDWLHTATKEISKYWRTERDGTGLRNRRIFRLTFRVNRNTHEYHAFIF
jgi:hypothetical protein